MGSFMASTITHILLGMLLFPNIFFLFQPMDSTDCIINFNCE